MVAVAGAVLWLVVDLQAQASYAHPAIPYWNALMLAVVFVLVVLLLTAFQAAHQHLEDTVQQRTAALQAEIAERKLLENAKVQAERLAVVGTMAAQMAHEVRNPLGSIMLNLDLVAGEVGNLVEGKAGSAEEARTLVDDMRAEVRRIQRVIEDYLRFGRMPKLRREAVSLNEWLASKLDFMEAAFEEANVTLHTELPTGLPLVEIDPEQLWQAALNLIRNGIEAMPSGGTLSLSTRREGAWVLIAVTDTGRGMTADQVQQVFVPFLSSKPDGTGLGLVLAQQIVHEHGGHLDCVSEVGRGTTFTVFLPLSENAPNG